jgi:hypothetical protein
VAYSMSLNDECECEVMAVYTGAREYISMNGQLWLGSETRCFTRGTRMRAFMQVQPAWWNEIWTLFSNVLANDITKSAETSRLVAALPLVIFA